MSKVQPRRRPASVHDLDDALLAAVLTAVDPCSKSQLPLVCRRWRELCDGAPQVWEATALDFSGGRVQDSSAMYRWVVRRRGAVKRLTLITESEHDWFSAHLVLGLLAGGLEHVDVRRGAEGLGMSSVAWLAVLPRLRSLKLQFERRSGLDGTTFPPGLEELSLHPVQMTSMRVLPSGVSQLGQLRSLCLYRVYNFMADGSVAIPGSLSNLEHLALRRSHLLQLPDLAALAKLTAFECLGVDCRDWAALATASQLRDLRLLNCRLLQLPGAVEQLTALTRLRLAKNSITSLPVGPYLAGLLELDFTRNRFAALPAKALASCTALEVLVVKVAGTVDGVSMACSSRDLRRLLGNHASLRHVSIPRASGVSESQLRAIRASFPAVELVKVDTHVPPISDSDSDSFASDFSDDESSGDLSYGDLSGDSGGDSG